MTHIKSSVPQYIMWHRMEHASLFFLLLYMLFNSLRLSYLHDQSLNGMNSVL